jgi:dTMP kinase
MTSRKTARRGRFIVLEGLDGAGTTTQSRALVDHIARKGEKVLATHEPTDGPIGNMLRQVLRGRLVAIPHAGVGEPKPSPMDPAAVALLFAADRLDHLHHQVIPHLEAGHHVVCDRYLISSLAYQGLETDLRFVRAINEKALKADLTIFLRVPPEVAMARVEASRTSRDTFEQLPLQRKIASNYEKILETWKDGDVVVIDGTEEVSAVTAKVRGAVDRFF